MLVCHCKGVSDRQLRDAVTSGATTPGRVARRCGAGSVCGGCRPVIDEILREAAVGAAEPRHTRRLAPAR